MNLTCDFCLTEAAVIITPGNDSVLHKDVNSVADCDPLIVVGEPIRRYCWDCAKARGWPKEWGIVSEKPKRKRS